MTKRIGRLFSVGLALSALLLATRARADGVALSPSELPDSARIGLEAQIAKARAKTPALFDTVRKVDPFRADVVARTRDNRPSATRAYMRLGSRALLPMLEMLAFEADVSRLNPEQRLVVADGLLQAVAFARDMRAAPVLREVFLRTSDSRLRASAAVGLGMLGRAEDRALLLTAAAKASPRRAAALAGLGHSRSEDVASFLAVTLSEPLDEELASVTARSLGYVGSSWAHAARPSADSRKIRKQAARALVSAFPRQSAKVRLAIARSLLMIEEPESVTELATLEQSGAPALRVEARRLRALLQKKVAPKR